MKYGDNILKTELESIKADLIEKHKELGMEASGDWVNSIEVKTNKLHGQIEANDYSWYLQHGRKPGKMPPIKAIEKWINDKGIVPLEKNLKISSLAFLIARKIKEEGTKYHKQGGTDLIDSVVTEERIQSIIDKISYVHITKFKSQIINLYKEIAS